MATAHSTAQQMRRWEGPALFSFGFRPFFLFGALYAALIVGIWLPWYWGHLDPPSALPPVAWHTHELLFGYAAAAIAGFLMTAVPNWTGRLPAVGWPLIALFTLWVAGRLAATFSGVAGLWPVAFAGLAFPLALGAFIAREILAAGNLRNLKVLALVALFAAAQAFFYWEIHRHGYPVYADRAAIAAVLLLIMVIGGRIVPSFTANWLKKRGGGALPEPFGRLDTLCLGIGVLALGVWAAGRSGAVPPGVAAGLLLPAGGLHAWRLARWRGHRTLAEPLVTILHAGYLFVPVGFLLAGFAALEGNVALDTAATHAWTAGAMGTMTLAVMTRASLGHTGQPLLAGPVTMGIYAAILTAGWARIGAGIFPDTMALLLPLSALAWVAAFLGFGVAYGPLLLKPRAG